LFCEILGFHYNSGTLAPRVSMVELVREEREDRRGALSGIESRVRGIGQVAKVHMLASDLARLHAAAMNSCEEKDQSRIDVAGSKARNLSATVSRIDGELAKSLAAMRQKLATERSASTRAKDDVNRFTVVAHDFSMLDLQTQELAKAIQGIAQNIRTAAASCNPTPIPPLFAEANPPPKVASITRPHPTRRRRPAAAAQRPVRFLPRF
jgi:hypothetical protein